MPKVDAPEFAYILPPNEARKECVAVSINICPWQNPIQLRNKVNEEIIANI